MIDPRFPELTPRQIKKLQMYGTVETLSERTLIFKSGQTNYDFYVVLKGEIIVEDPSNENAIIVTHKKNEFSGDNSMLSSRAAVLNGYAKEGTHLLRIKPHKLKEAISKHSDISDVLLNAFLLRQETVLGEIIGGLKLIGTEDSKEAYAIRDFMEKNHIWFHFIDVNKNEDAIELLSHFDVSKEDLPVLIAEDKVCKNPSIEEVARNTGVLTDFEDTVFDVLVVGAGPAGLAASVYAASEGLNVVTIDGSAPGGQAGKSSKIENYLGFPTGISGNDLANRAYVQAQKFGCTISIPHEAKRITRTGNHFKVEATHGKTIETKSIVVATGANYRNLPIDNIEDFEGSGVFYSATGMNISSCTNEEVGVVGGGNSAGQAALFLANHAKKVHIILRGGDLGSKMSDYLVQRILASPTIKVHFHKEVTVLGGNTHLEEITLSCNKENTTEVVPISNLFTFIGAKPCTEWLDGLVAMDDRGFICTGEGISKEALQRCAIFSTREPQSLETNIPGFFAVGDVRKGSVKRVAGAVGEGSVVISQVHQYLGDLDTLAFAKA